MANAVRDGKRRGLERGGKREVTLRDRLEAAYERFHRAELLGTDPLCVVHRYESAEEREAAALIAACLAYGNVKAIMGGIEGLLGRMDGEPGRWLRRYGTAGRVKRALKGFRYRVTGEAEMAGLLLGAAGMIRREGSLGEGFVARLEESDATVVGAMGRWVEAMRVYGGCALGHLLPHPERGSACKRLNLMLRWLVRKDAVDVGGWEGVGTRRLVVPLDTHLHGVAIRLGMTARRGANLATALEVTEALRGVCADDPLRYDFALTRPGIMRLAEADDETECEAGVSDG